MPKLTDKTGNRYGRLVVLERMPNVGTSVMWKCRCDCGAVKTVRTQSLDVIKSCGCYSKEYHAKLKRTHGLSHTPEHTAWLHMLQRCTNPNDKRYKDYGGRGITVHELFRDFINFYNHVGKRPSSDYSLDRIDNEGNYEPGNLRWATRKQQQNNMRRNRDYLDRYSPKLVDQLKKKKEDTNPNPMETVA
jgi:hypothetical protein